MITILYPYNYLDIFVLLFHLIIYYYFFFLQAKKDLCRIHFIALIHMYVLYVMKG